MNWISVKDKLPEYYMEVLIAYSDEDGENPGICRAALQLGDEWFLSSVSEQGADYDDEHSIITHWFDYQNYLNYPNEC